MATYPSCRECGDDLTTSEEQEQELCAGCQRDCKPLTKEAIENWLRIVNDKARICPICMTILIEADGKLYCPTCHSTRGNSGRRI